MPFVISATSSNRSTAPAGVHNAVCVDVINKGLMETKFGKKTKLVIRWELDAEDEGTGKRYVIGEMYSVSLHEKANLRKMLETWRGRKFTADELRGWDIETLIGVPCQLVVAHKDTDDGNTYANVVSVVPASKAFKLKPSGQYVRQPQEVHEAPLDVDQAEEDAPPF